MAWNVQKDGMTEVPEKIRTSECKRYEIWWDRSVETPKKLDHNRPDMVLIDKKDKKWLIIDFAVPNDKNILKTCKTKIDKYSELSSQVRKTYHVETKILPLVVGALGAIPDSLSANLF